MQAAPTIHNAQCTPCRHAERNGMTTQNGDSQHVNGNVPLYTIKTYWLQNFSLALCAI